MFLPLNLLREAAPYNHGFSCSQNIELSAILLACCYIELYNDDEDFSLAVDVDENFSLVVPKFLHNSNGLHILRNICIRSM